MVAISQLNRGPEQRTGYAGLSDLREPGSLEQDADTVILLHRPGAFERDDPRADKPAGQVSDVVGRSPGINLARHALGLRGMGDYPALLADSFDEKLPTTHIQPGITVGHEDLRTVGDLDITHRTRRSSLRQ